MATKKRNLETDAFNPDLSPAALSIGTSLPYTLKRERAVSVPTATDVEAGVMLLASTAKTTKTDVELFEVIVSEVAAAMRNRESNEIGMTGHEARLLIDSGEFTPEEFAEVARFVTSGELASLERSTHLRALINTYTSAEAAALLDLDASSLRPRKGVSRFYSFVVGAKRLYPKWQFVPDGDRARVLPNLAKVIEAIPEGWGPADVEGFMMTPQEELEPARDSGEWLAPAEWLAAIKDPDPVVQILAEADIT